MGITKAFTGTSLVEKDVKIWIEDTGETIAEEDIICSPRVGIDYAEECALWDWRFRIKGNKWASKAK